LQTVGFDPVHDATPGVQSSCAQIKFCGSQWVVPVHAFTIVEPEPSALHRASELPLQNSWFATHAATEHEPPEHSVPLGQSLVARHWTHCPWTVSQSSWSAVHCLSEVQAVVVRQWPAPHVWPGVQSALVAHSAQRRIAGSQTVLAGQSSEFLHGV
jgi:hypothetical protein